MKTLHVSSRRGDNAKCCPVRCWSNGSNCWFENEEVKTLCESACNENQKVTPANYNAIGQVVVAGHTPAVERLIELANEAGARLAKVIPVSVPCHCPLLTEASELFARIFGSG